MRLGLPERLYGGPVGRCEPLGIYTQRGGQTMLTLGEGVAASVSEDLPDLEVLVNGMPYHWVSCAFSHSV